jgi:rod shape-determining protein MreB
VFLVEEPMAAAIGANIPVSSPNGYVVVDIGGGTTEIGVTSLGGLVLSKSIKVAGDRFDKAIIDYVRQNFNLYIGERTAESIKLEIGTAIKMEDDKTIQVKGRDSSGLLSTIELTGEGVRNALREPLKEISLAVRQVLEEMPPDLAGDVVDNGIILTGGGALIHGIDSYLSSDIKLPVQVAEEPLLAVAYGTSKVLDEDKLLKLISNE